MAKPPKLRARLYARTSSQRQADDLTIKTQLDKAPGFCAAQGYELTGVYQDDGFSARAGAKYLAQRTDLARMIKDYRAGEFDVALIYHLDRFTRSDDGAERNAILSTFKVIGDMSSGSVFDQRTIPGEVMVFLGGVFAAEDNRKRMARAKDGAARARKEGRYLGGQLPYGLTWSKARGWEIVEAEATLVREAYRRIAAGESATSVGLDFDRRGIPTPGSKLKLRTKPSRPGGRVKTAGSWAQALPQLVRRTTYRGEMCAKPGISGPPIVVPAIVSPDLWARARASMGANYKQGLDRTLHEYLLLGLAVCGVCGMRIDARSPQQERSGNRSAPRYACRSKSLNRRRPSDKPCDLPRRLVAGIDAEIWADVCSAVKDTSVLERALATGKADSAEAKQWARDLAGYKAKLAKLDQGAAELRKLVTRGLMTADEAGDAMAETKREREFLQGQIASAATRTTKLDDARRGLDDIVKEVADGERKLEAWPFAKRRALVEKLIGRVVIHAERVQVFCEYQINPRSSAPTLVNNSACPAIDECRTEKPSRSVKFRLVV